MVNIIRWRWIALAALLLVLPESVSMATAQSSPLVPRPAGEGILPPSAVATRDESGQVVMRSTPLPEPLVLDGRLDEPIYKTVPSVAGFIQQEPHAGELATEDTEVWVFHDANRLYVSARCWDSHPDRAVIGDMRRDGESHNIMESLMIALDTYHDRRNGYTFGVNSAGGMAESSVTNEREANRDWNTVWDARVTRFENGWTYEVAIPFKSVRYTAGPQTWGLQVRRVVRWKNELSHLTPVPASAGGSGVFRFSSAGTLVGFDLPPTGQHIEVKPYALAGTTTDRKASPPAAHDISRSGGLDVKYGVTRSLTADFTYRTDFAQVEDDAQQINLTRFTLFFPERREFFLEGQGIFNIAGRGVGAAGDVPVLFFSRRIGLENGRPVPIDAGGRLSGRAGKYSIGVITVQAGEEPRAGVRPTSFHVARVKRDILGRSSIGAMVARRSDSVVGTGANDTYALDGVFSFFENLRFNTYYAQTSTPGLSRDNRSYRAQMDFAHDRYALQLERLKVGEHFNPEVGFLRRRDFLRQFALAKFTPRPRRLKAVRKLYWEAGFDQFTNGRGLVETRRIDGAYRMDLESGDGFNLELTHQYELLEAPFAVAPGISIPRGGYTFQEIRPSYELGTQWKVSGTVRYEQGTFYSGRRKAINYTSGRVRLANLWFFPGLTWNWVDLPQGGFTSKVSSLRTLYTLTPRMFLSALTQYNSSAASLSVNLRLRWEYRPSSELFVVYNEGRTTLGAAPGLDSRAFIVKLTRLVRF